MLQDVHTIFAPPTLPWESVSPRLQSGEARLRAVMTSALVGRMQVDDLIEAVNDVYSGKDGKRSLWDVWMHANHHAAGIAEKLRKSDGEHLYIEIADFALWIFTMVKKLQGPMGDRKPSDTSEQESLIRIGASYSELLWQRYPATCPLCYGRKMSKSAEAHEGSCVCGVHPASRRTDQQKRAQSASLREYSCASVLNKPKGLDEWQRMFEEVFGGVCERGKLAEVALHLLEEMGEMSDALMRMYSFSPRTFIGGEPLDRQRRLEEELADWGGPLG
jgi:NTP pyrophosphatase (non-canonical NTP hydrolase)